MSQYIHTVDPRSLSEKKHQLHAWGSSVHSVPRFARGIVNLFSFKHAGIDKLAKFCPTRARILDFGTGNGNFSIYLSTSINSTIFAVDWSFEGLRQALKKFSQLRILPVCADLHFLPFKDESFTAFFTVDVFGHLHAPPKALDELYRVLQPGAQGFFHTECSDYRKHWPDSWLITKNGHDIPAESDGHVSLLTINAIKSFLSFKFKITKNFSPAGYLGWLTGYPEKYTDAFYLSGNKALLTLNRLFSKIKYNPAGKVFLRFFNYLTNRTELLFNLQGGGSFFADVIKPVSEKKITGISIDIIIPTYNRAVQVNMLVKQILVQCKVDDTIIIVSQDKTLKLDVNSPKIHILYTSPANLPEARNRGLQSGINEIVLFLDDDVVVPDNLLEQHRAVYTDSNINCIAGSVSDSRFSRQTTSPSVFNFKTGELIQNFLYPETSLSISFMGAHFSLRRSILNAVSCFDTAFIGNAYWEDIDFSFRLQKKGWSIHYHPDIRVIHTACETGGCRSKSKLSFCYEYFTNATYFSLKYLPIKHTLSWLSYWKYRMEFETRPNKDSTFFKHDPILLAASAWGVITGVIRFLLKGKRTGLPESVIHKQTHEST